MQFVLIVLIGGMLIGAVLALVGAGGALLAIPILKYGAGYSQAQAMGAAFLVVITSALASVIRGRKERGISLRYVAVYGTIAGSTAATVAYYAPGFPGAVRTLLYVIVLVVSGMMVFLPIRHLEPVTTSPAWGKTLLLHTGPALAIGTIAGLLGVGGGFLYVPVLRLFAGLSMHHAVGSALMIVLATALLGFGGALPFLISSDVNWLPVVLLAGIAYITSHFMTGWRGRFPEQVLKRSFAIMLWLLAAWEIWQYAME